MASSIKKQARDYELIAASWHEAAHTICGLYNFMKVYNVRVISDKYEHGNALYEICDPSDIKDKILLKILSISEVQTLYAGLVGEKIYYKEICGSDRFPMHLRIGSSNDIRDASKLINKFNLAPPGEQRFSFKKEIQNETKKILSDYWNDVTLISHNLYRHKELNYDEIKYILTRRSINKEFWKDRYKNIKIIFDDKTNVDEKFLKEILIQYLNIIN